MPGTTSRADAPHAADFGEWVDRVADQFESAWAGGERPAIAAFLGESTGPSRTALLGELIKIDLEYHRRENEPRTLDEYLADFPELRGSDGRLPRDLVLFANRAGDERSRAAEVESSARPAAETDTHIGPVPANTPAMLGRFEIVRQLGAGAFGEVYLAHDAELNRTVAIKLPRDGSFPNEESKVRFLREARAAARLEHPGIVPVYEIAHERELPYIVIGYIEGETLADRLARGKPPPREAAELIARVADALDYAHREELVHRDVKPTNILIDADGRPHVTDFGLVKLGSAEATLTLDRQIVGTPAYMSPEQARGDSADADARSDIYSVGVVLYELLTGRRPFRADFPVLCQQILHEEPPMPRRIDRGVPRDLQTICRKAMQKSPADRYATAAEMAADLRRFLKGEPILARPVGDIERLWRWAKRKPGVAVLAGSVLLLVVALAIGSSIAAVVFNRLAVRANEAADREEQKFLEAKAVKEQLIKALRSPDPSLDGRKVTVEQVLDRAVKELAEDLKLQPLIRAELLHVIGLTYRGLGLYGKAASTHERSLAIRKEHLGEDDALTLSTMTDLAWSYEWAGDLKKAVPLYEQVLRGRRALLGEDHLDTLQSKSYLGAAYERVQKFDDAIRLLEEARDGRRAALGEDHPDTLLTISDLALAYGSAGRREDAIRLNEHVLERRRTVQGEDEVDTFTSMNNLAVDYMNAGRLDESISLLKEVLKLRRKKLGENHPDTLLTISNLGMAYRRNGQFKLAISFGKQALEARRIRLGNDHHFTIASIGNLATAYSSAGEFDKALPLFEEALKRTTDLWGEDDPQTLTVLHNLAFEHKKAGRLQKSIPLYEQALEKRRSVLGPNHKDTLITVNGLGKAFAAGNQWDNAVPLYEQVYKARRTTLGEDHKDTLYSMHTLAATYVAAGDRKRGFPLFERAVEKLQRTGHRDTIIATGNLGVAYYNARRYDKALPYYKAVLKHRREKLGDDHTSTLGLMGLLAHVLGKARQYDEALQLRREALERTRAKSGDDHADTLRAMNGVATALQDVGRLDEAIAMHDRTLSARRKKLGEDHADTLISLNNLAYACEAAGRTARAIELYRQAHARQKAKHGEDHSKALVPLSNLGFAFRSAGEWDKAIDTLRTVHRIHRDKRGDDDPKTLLALNALASTCTNAQQFAVSLPLHEEYLKRCRTLHGDDHANTIIALNNLAWAQMSAGDAESAMPLYEQVLEKRKAMHGEDHRNTCSAGTQLGVACMHAGRLARGASLLEKSLAWQREHLGEDDADTLASKNSLARVFWRSARMKGAEALFRDCWQIKRKNKPDDWHTFLIQVRLGAVLADQRRFEEAEPLLVTGYRALLDRRKKIPPLHRHELAAAVQRIVALYLAQGKPDEADRWRQAPGPDR